MSAARPTHLLGRAGPCPSMTGTVLAEPLRGGAPNSRSGARSRYVTSQARQPMIEPSWCWLRDLR
jgi:hypothetical protein